MSTRPPASIAIEATDDLAFIASIARESKAPVDVRIHHVIDARVFEVCPICSAAPTSAEHVPQEAIGGKRLTRTCNPCNTRLGTNIEADLIDWVDNVIARPRLSGDPVPGARRTGRILVRHTVTGEPVLFIDAAPPEFEPILASGQVELTADTLDMNNVRIALLKQLYLARCLDGGITEDPLADAIRRDLIAARDADSRRDVPVSILATR